MQNVFVANVLQTSANTENTSVPWFHSLYYDLFAWQSRFNFIANEVSTCHKSQND